MLVERENNMYCLKCGKNINDNAKFCGFCGKKTTVLPKSESTTVTEPQTVNIVNRETVQVQTNQIENLPKCNRCGSTSLIANKKGFGIGKAAVGAVLLGPLGLLAGGIGSNKIKVTCLKCGNSFEI